MGAGKVRWVDFVSSVTLRWDKIGETFQRVNFHAYFISRPPKSAVRNSSEEWSNGIICERVNCIIKMRTKKMVEEASRCISQETKNPNASTNGNFVFVRLN